jgi:hypothetical protein
MFSGRIGLLTLSIFFVLSGSFDIAESKATKKKSAQETKVLAQVEGFRSAKFGMDEKSIFRAIRKDFKVSRNQVTRSVHNIEQTTSLKISVPKLLELGGRAKIGYVMGHKSKKLISINVIWGSDGKVTKEQASLKQLVDTANFLRNHLTKKRYEKDEYAVNAVITEETTVVFRGKDKKGRMIMLVLANPKPLKGKNGKDIPVAGKLRLSYILDPKNPDILTIGDNDF